MVGSAIVVPLEITPPFHAEALLTFFGRHAVPGVEAYRDQFEIGTRRLHYARTLRLASGPAALELTWAGAELVAKLHLSQPTDLAGGRQCLERLFDLARDVAAPEAHLSLDPLLAPLVHASPGLRIPGTVDVPELVIRTMVGQQISLAGAASCAGKLAARFGQPWPDGALETPAGPLSRLFPASASLAAADPTTLPMPAARGRALVEVAEALESQTLVVTPASDAVEARRDLLALRGIGPWTADYVLMRGLHHPDVLLASDLVIKRELERRGSPDVSRWAPWRSYATMHLWRAWTG
ncbi:MAG TPA: AlkA N-terminal domain-containing protein [Propionibacteriaceae bacterium]|nr:AlkA N-terminal domain-containing protein [Propionibacteriaceae bacterium]